MSPARLVILGGSLRLVLAYPHFLGDLDLLASCQCPEFPSRGAGMTVPPAGAGVRFRALEGALATLQESFAKKSEGKCLAHASYCVFRVTTFEI